MSSNQISRPNFFEGQYLGAADLTSAVDYGRVEDARHALGAHTWGVAAGLQLTERDSPAGGGQVDVFIQPGYAWDGFGRPIVVLTPVKISAELLKAVVFNNALDGGTPAGRLFKVWLRYDESATQQPGAGFQVCGADDQFSRIGETFRIAIGEFPAHASHAPISVAGYSIDAQETLQKLDPKTPALALFDESVPYQDFPTDNPKARWLVPLGEVRWLPNPVANQPGNFVKREAADLAHSNSLRRYIGVVAGAVEAADGVVRLHDRTKPYSTVASEDLVWVEGSLRVEGDAHLFGGNLDFRDQNGLDNGGIPLLLQRQDVTGTSGSLQAVIGKADQGRNTFAVGPLDNANHFVPKLTVRDDGKVGVGTTTPLGLLTLNGLAPTQGLLTLFSQTADFEYDGGNDGLFVFKDTGGKTAFTGGNIGIGTTNPVGRLTLNGLSPAQGLLTLFSQSADFEYDGGNDGLFVFKDTGGKTAFTGGNIGIGTTNPVGRLTLNGLSPAQGLLTLFSQTADFEYDGGNDGLFVFNDTGGRTAFMGGNVGIGATNPYAKLTIAGSIGFTNDTSPMMYIFQTGTTNPERSVIAHSPDFPNWGISYRDNGDIMIFQKGGTPVMSVDLGGQTVSIAGALIVQGNASKPGGGGWGDSSDLRLKKNVEPLTDALSKLLQLRGVRFEWIEPEKMGNLTGKQVGFVAQEVEPVFPGWISTRPDGYKEMTVRGFEALAIEALRELKQEIDGTKARLDTLETRRATRKTK
jgi:Chaperone of endosialidase